MKKGFHTGDSFLLLFTALKNKKERGKNQRCQKQRTQKKQ
nr:MAG TPA: hypothetical protein [Caudoviricetes sp.]